MKITYSFGEFAKCIQEADPGLFPGYRIADVDTSSYNREITVTLVKLEATTAPKDEDA